MYESHRKTVGRQGTTGTSEAVAPGEQNEHIFLKSQMENWVVAQEGKTVLEKAKQVARVEAAQI